MKLQAECPLCSTGELLTIKTYTYSESSATSASVKRLIGHYLRLFHDGRESAKVEVSQCVKCGFIFTNPRLSTQDLSLKYSTISEEDKSLREGLPPHLDKRRARVAQLVNTLIGEECKERPLNILDYGGAEGYLLSPFIDSGGHGFVMDYIDYEKEDDRIVHLPMNEISADRKYDFIFLFHVLEHVAEPVELIKRLGSWLTPTGKLCIEVPLGAWLEWEDIREPLTHVNYFSEESLSVCIEQAGLSIHEVNSQWQFTTHPAKTVCINLVAGREETVATVARKSTSQQMKSTHQLAGGLSQNPRYYLKMAVRSLLARR